VEIFVYYRMRASDAAAALEAFGAARGEADPAALRILQRQDSEPSLLTWMEIYGPGLTDPFGLEARIAQAMTPFVQGLRHREVFAVPPVGPLGPLGPPGAGTTAT